MEQRAVRNTVTVYKYLESAFPQEGKELVSSFRKVKTEPKVTGFKMSREKKT